MGYVPLVIWFVCVTTLLLLLTRATLARGYKSALEKQKDLQDLVDDLLSSFNALDIKALPSPIQVLKVRLSESAIGIRELPSKDIWLAADKELYKLQMVPEPQEWVLNTRPKVVAAAKMLYKAEVAKKSYNDFVKTLPTSYGAFMFGYKQLA